MVPESTDVLESKCMAPVVVDSSSLSRFPMDMSKNFSMSTNHNGSITSKEVNHAGITTTGSHSNNRVTTMNSSNNKIDNLKPNDNITVGANVNGFVNGSPGGGSGLGTENDLNLLLQLSLNNYLLQTITQQTQTLNCLQQNPAPDNNAQMQLLLRLIQQNQNNNVNTNANSLTSLAQSLGGAAGPGGQNNLPGTNPLQNLNNIIAGQMQNNSSNLINFSSLMSPFLQQTIQTQTQVWTPLEEIALVAAVTDYFFSHGCITLFSPRSHHAKSPRNGRTDNLVEVEDSNDQVSKAWSGIQKNYKKIITEVFHVRVERQKEDLKTRYEILKEQHKKTNFLKELYIKWQGFHSLNKKPFEQNSFPTFQSICQNLKDVNVVHEMILISAVFEYFLLRFSVASKKRDCPNCWSLIKSIYDHFYTKFTSKYKSDLSKFSNSTTAGKLCSDFRNIQKRLAAKKLGNLKPFYDTLTMLFNASENGSGNPGSNMNVLLQGIELETIPGFPLKNGSNRSMNGFSKASPNAAHGGNKSLKRTRSIIEGAKTMMNLQNSQEVYEKYAGVELSGQMGSFHPNAANKITPLKFDLLPPLPKKQKMSSRSSNEDTYQYSLGMIDSGEKQKRTKWTEEDLIILWKNIARYGNEWQKVKNSLGNRTYHQVKDKGKRLLHDKGWMTGRSKVYNEQACEQAKSIAIEHLNSVN